MHEFLKQIGLELLFPWQQIAPIVLLWGNCCGHRSNCIFVLTFFLSSKKDYHDISVELEYRLSPHRLLMATLVQFQRSLTLKLFDHSKQNFI